jgi:hypothetical protein
VISPNLAVIARAITWAITPVIAIYKNLQTWARKLLNFCTAHICKFCLQILSSHSLNFSPP